MDHLLHPVSGDAEVIDEGRRVYVLLDDDADQPVRGVLEWAC